MKNKITVVPMAFPVKNLYPCCNVLQSRIVDLTNNISFKDGKFIWRDDDGYNPQEIMYCPYCGKKLKTI